MPGVSLAYRRGYFADDPNAPAQKNQAQNAKPDPNQYSALRAAMLHGGPEPTELIFAASVRPASTDTEAALVQGNQVVKKVSGPYRRYGVTFITNPKQVNWTVTPDGAHHCTLEFMNLCLRWRRNAHQRPGQRHQRSYQRFAIRSDPERQYQVFAADQRSRQG